MVVTSHFSGQMTRKAILGPVVSAGLDSLGFVFCVLAAVRQHHVRLSAPFPKD